MTGSAFEAHWLGMEGIFGGLVLGRMVDRADCLEGFSPQSLTVHFVAAVKPGEVELLSELIHRGRATASMRLELRQEARVRTHAIASLVPRDQAVSWRRAVDPQPWGDPETTPIYRPRHREMSYGEHLEVREVGTPTLEGGAGCWVRMVTEAQDHGLLGPHGVASVFLDALPPGLFAEEARPDFVPTIDFTVHFAPQLGDLGHEWHYVTNHTVWTSRDFCVEESTLYDRRGNTLAQVRQGRAIRWE